ncbi:MAG: ribose-5-phosphate isomerase RpiA [Candidatus Methanomethylicia archaeon]
MLDICRFQAAQKALNHVKNGIVLGLGTGSTVAVFIELLAKMVKSTGLNIKCVATSYQSEHLAVDFGLNVLPLESFSCIDLAVDGADEVDSRMVLIKGGGAALTREKVVASMAKEYIVIVDYSKLSSKIGEKKPVPIEVLPYAWRYVMKKIEKLNGKPYLRSGGEYKDGPIVTDNGNFIVDAYFGVINDPEELEYRINSIAGVVECGLFVGLAKRIYVGYPDRVDEMLK